MKNLIEFLNNKLANTLNNEEIINYIKDYNYEPIYVENNTNTYLKTLLHRCDKYEVYQIDWPKQSFAPLHRHPKNGCVLKVIQGRLHEIVYQGITLIKNNVHIKGKVSYIDDSIGLHKVHALEDTISLHIYAPPNFYDQKN